MNKNVLLLASLATLFTGSASGADTSVTITPSFASEYMFRGIRLGGPSFQPAAELSRGDLIVGLWANLPIADRVPGQSDPELDPYISYTFNINDQLSIVPGLVAYIFPEAVTAHGFYGVTGEPNLAVNYTVAGVKLTPKVYYDVILQGPTFELNIAYTVPLEQVQGRMRGAARKAKAPLRQTNREKKTIALTLERA